MNKRILSLGLILFSALLANAQPPEGKALPGDHYGAVVSASGAEPIKRLPSKLDGETPVATKIKAKVLDVCPKKGCWLKLEVNDSTTAFVKMKDYGFFLPTAIKGKTIVLDGEAIIKTTSVAELRHYAEDAKKSKQEIEAITKPQEEIRLTANGIVVVK